MKFAPGSFKEESGLKKIFRNFSQYLQKKLFFCSFSKLQNNFDFRANLSFKMQLAFRCPFHVLIFKISLFLLIELIHWTNLNNFQLLQTTFDRLTIVNFVFQTPRRPTSLDCRFRALQSSPSSSSAILPLTTSRCISMRESATYWWSN